MTVKLRRREFMSLAASGMALIGLTGRPMAGLARRRGIKLGFDNFSVRACGWKAERLLDCAAELELDTILFSDLFVFENHDSDYLKDLRKKAADLGVEIQAGTGSVCPTSSAFKPDFGDAAETLSLTIRVAHLLGSSVARCYMGTAQDRLSQGGLENHMAETVQVFKSVRSLAVDLGVKIAIENHAGDMQAHQLKALIEEAGPDFVGATLDSGNAAWTLEDPIENLKVLGPYAVSTGIRDSMVWETEEGAVVQWTAIGEGLVDQGRYFDLFQELCPGVPVQLEIISGFQRSFPYLREDFWKGYPEVRAETFSKFVAMAKRGKPIQPARFPEGAERQPAEARYQMAELERSVKFCKTQLGLGLKGGSPGVGG